jgi:hypothetical protein
VTKQVRTCPHGVTLMARCPYTCVFVSEENMELIMLNRYVLIRGS